MQTPVKLHYVDDIFYAVKLCICLHNAMVVHHIENGEEQETEDMYDMTTNTENSLELDEEEVRDSAQIDIEAEDNFFAANQHKLNQNSDVVDLELLEKYNRAQFLGQRLRVVNRRWKNLIDKDNHYKLQEAIMKAISKNIK